MSESTLTWTTSVSLPIGTFVQMRLPRPPWWRLIRLWRWWRNPVGTFQVVSSTASTAKITDQSTYEQARRMSDDDIIRAGLDSDDRLTREIANRYDVACVKLRDADQLSEGVNHG